MDLRTFSNFDLGRDTLHAEDREDNINDAVCIEVTDEVFDGIQEIVSLGSIFHDFVCVASDLTVFNPGIYLLDRSLSDIVDRNPVSLCWTNNAQILISLVDRCQNLTILNLEGYSVHKLNRCACDEIKQVILKDFSSVRM